MRLLDLNDYLPRLLGVAVACQDWANARQIVSRIKEAIKSLRANVTIQPPLKPDEQWDGYLRHLKRSLLEAVLRSYPFDHAAESSVAADRLIEFINSLSPAVEDLFAYSIIDRARELFWSDLARVPFKDFLLDNSGWPNTTRLLDTEVLPTDRKERSHTISRFLSEIDKPLSTLAPLLFPTRPLSAPDVTELYPKTASDLALLREFVHALRGTWVGPLSPGKHYVENNEIIEIGIVRNGKSANSADELPD